VLPVESHLRAWASVPESRRGSGESASGVDVRVEMEDVVRVPRAISQALVSQMTASARARRRSRSSSSAMVPVPVPVMNAV